ncbi:hypothetical protein LTR28_013361 [Elasticomyces elasticus]|nr:hypothetical protein LTR28_013361 [Elasticomyces elasticus]
MTHFDTGYMVQEKPYCVKGYRELVKQSIVVDHLQKTYSTQSTGNVGIAFVYCNYKEVEQNAASLIASLLQQLVEQQPSMPDSVRSLCEVHMRQRTRPGLAELSTLLQNTANQFSKVFVVVDALDESPEETRRELIVEILKLRQDLHFIATSRHNADTEHLFRDASLLEIRADDADVESYVHGQIDRGDRLGRFVQADPSLREKIVEGIVSKAQGMFLLAQLHIKSLERKQDRKAVRLALARLPQEIDEIYDDALDRINSQNRDDAELAQRILMWVTFATRPLKVKEVQHAIAVMNLEPGETHIDKDALPEEDLLLSVCAGIVVIGKKTSVVQLVHYTTQEYFERVRFKRFPTAQASIAEACLACLSLDNTKMSPCSDRSAMKCLLQENPLINYAAANWGTHARGPPERTLLANIMDFLDGGAATECVARIIRYQFTSFDQVLQSRQKNHECHSSIPKVAYAASLGLTEVVSALLDEHCNVNAPTSDGTCALYLASLGGHEAVAKLLLDRGAEINYRNSGGDTALTIAVVRRQEAVAKLLLDRGAEVNHRDSVGQTALTEAARRGQEAVAKLLLDRGAEVNARTSLGHTALTLAAATGHEALAKLLLDRGAEVNTGDLRGTTPLQGAVLLGKEAVANLLLDRGAEVNYRDLGGNTALILAVKTGYEGNEAIAKLLLDRGAEVDARDSQGMTALIVAVTRHDGESATSMISLLLDRGAEINAYDCDGQTALAWAIERNFKAVAELLLDRGAEVDARNSEGMTALIAVHGGTDPYMFRKDTMSTTSVKLLLEKGADVNARDSYGRTALIAATSLKMSGNEATIPRIKLLLDWGAEVDVEDKQGRTAMSLAVNDWKGKIVELLRKYGAKDPDDYSVAFEVLFCEA